MASSKRRMSYNGPRPKSRILDAMKTSDEPRKARVQSEWVSLEQAGDLAPGLYVGLNSEHGDGHMPVFNDGSTDDHNYTHVLAVNGALVLLPEADTWPDEEEDGA